MEISQHVLNKYWNILGFHDFNHFQFLIKSDCQDSKCAKFCVNTWKVGFNEPFYRYKLWCFVYSDYGLACDHNTQLCFRNVFLSLFVAPLKTLHFYNDGCILHSTSNVFPIDYFIKLDLIETADWEHGFSETCHCLIIHKTPTSKKQELDHISCPQVCGRQGGVGVRRAQEEPPAGPGPQSWGGARDSAGRGQGEQSLSNRWRGRNAGAAWLRVRFELQV